MEEIMRQNETLTKNSDSTLADWWAGVLEEDLLDATSERLLWSGLFVPPPPRPLFLEEAATPDGLTTCDLCSWAFGTKPYVVDAAREVPDELSWVLTLVIVSIISAAIGAVIMITVLHCKSKMKNGATTDHQQPQPNQSSRVVQQRAALAPPNQKTDLPLVPVHSTNNGVWSWLTSRRNVAPLQLQTEQQTEQNHYTSAAIGHAHDHGYSSVVGGDGEALYAELDRESNPAYQNSAYCDPDAPPSAPSSAYYSDLSSATERAYEVVGVVSEMGLMGSWDGHGHLGKLSAISETTPSDYV